MRMIVDPEAAEADVRCARRAASNKAIIHLDADRKLGVIRADGTYVPNATKWSEVLPALLEHEQIASISVSGGSKQTVGACPGCTKPSMLTRCGTAKHCNACINAICSTCSKPLSIAYGAVWRRCRTPGPWKCRSCARPSELVDEILQRMWKGRASQSREQNRERVRKGHMTRTPEQRRRIAKKASDAAKAKKAVG